MESPHLTLAEALRRGIALQEAGRLREAERCYRAVLATQPKHPAANHNMGLLAIQAGRPDVGLPFLLTALTVKPDSEKYWLSYLFALSESGQEHAARQALADGATKGLDPDVVTRLAARLDALDARNAAKGQVERRGILEAFAAGRFAAAEVLARSFTERHPGDAFGWKALGTSLVHLGRNEEAVSCLQQAVTANPTDPESAYGLGNALVALDRLSEAVVAYHNALKHKPDFPEAHNNLGTALRGLGRLSGAVGHYLQALAQRPDFPEAANNLGTAYLAVGSFDEAVKYFRQALELRPQYAAAYSNLGNALQELGRPGEAVEQFQKALELEPDTPEAHNNLGNALQALGRLDEAVASYRRALDLKADYAEASSNLGTALTELGRPDEAMAMYRHALALKPDDPTMCVNVGNAFKKLGYPEEALACYATALEHKPDDASTCNTMGNILQDLGRLPEAVTYYRRALSLEADYVEAYNNLGVALAAMGETGNAIDCFNRLLELEPYHAEAHNNLGNVLRECGQLPEAISHYARSLEIKADVPDVHNNLGSAFEQLARPEEAMERYKRALALKPDFLEAASNLLYVMAHCGQVAPEAYLEQARQWERIALSEEERETARTFVFDHPPRAGRKLKIGYVSGDFRQHAVSAFLEALFAGHDRDRVEVFAYAADPREDAITQYLQEGAEHWANLTGLGDAAATQRIRQDGIDVLVDLSGHTAGNRLGIFARRAAPVQAGYLGYFASTGLSAMDYVLSDGTVVPPEDDARFTETVWRLPRVWVAYHPPVAAPQPVWQPDPDGRIWFGSCNKYSKLTPATIDLWARILKECPQGHLVLKAAALESISMREQATQAFALRGIEPQRLHLTGREPEWTGHMAFHDHLDIALDPIGGHCGVTTTCDALWMGVPVVTLAGSGMIGRMGVSLLTALGREEWIAEDTDAYVATALRLADDVAGRTVIRAEQRETMCRSPLGDAAALACCLEDAYERMFDAWLAGQGSNRS